MEFAGKKIAITGAGREFGRTLAVNFAKLGAELFITARTVEKARVAETIVKGVVPDAIIHSFAADLLSSEQLRSFAKEIARVTDTIDILIHNAALWLEADFLETGDQDVIDAIGTSATGAILITKHLLPLLMTSKAADMVFLNGTTSLPNNRHSANEAFSAAKAAQSTFADRMRHRLRKQGIRVLTIYPPDFQNTSPLQPEEWNFRRNSFTDEKLTARNVFECIRFALLQDRICSVDKIVLSNNNGWDGGN
jgi:NAD(P)-dependent dehydrogenase (short-subunit alcohol dehydrogenase family)